MPRGTRGSACSRVRMIAVAIISLAARVVGAAVIGLERTGGHERVRPGRDLDEVLVGGREGDHQVGSVLGSSSDRRGRRPILEDARGGASRAGCPGGRGDLSRGLRLPAGGPLSGLLFSAAEVVRCTASGPGRETGRGAC